MGNIASYLKEAYPDNEKKSQVVKPAADDEDLYAFGVSAAKAVKALHYP